MLRQRVVTVANVISLSCRCSRDCVVKIAIDDRAGFVRGFECEGGAVSPDRMVARDTSKRVSKSWTVECGVADDIKHLQDLQFRRREVRSCCRR